VIVNSNGRLGTAPSAPPALNGANQPLSAATGRRLLAQVKRQQAEIRGLREKVSGADFGH